MENATGMGNLEHYQQSRAVPDNARRAVTGGRLKGKTEINPMWRIKALTEVFGPCGIGWKYEITQKWLQPQAFGKRDVIGVSEFFVQNVICRIIALMDQVIENFLYGISAPPVP